MDRRGQFAAILALTAAPFCRADGISESDRSYALSALHASRKQLLDATSGLSRTQWRFKPSPDAWSIAEIVEHLALLEEQFPKILAEAMKTPAAPERKLKNARAADEKILAMLPDRSRKAQAPEQFKPSGKYKDGPAAVAAFKAARERVLESMRKTQEPLREHFYKHPALGDLDAYQWYLMVAGHTERHVNQMLEVKASPGFPKK
jgi:hypothetical protein